MVYSKGTHISKEVPMEDLVYKLIIAAIASAIGAMGLNYIPSVICTKHHAHYHTPFEQPISDNHPDEEDLT